MDWPEKETSGMNCRNDASVLRSQSARQQPKPIGTIQPAPGDPPDESLRPSPPAPASSLFRGHARVVQPTLIEEVAVAICTCSPSGRGNRVNNHAQVALVQLQSLDSLLRLIHQCDALQ